MRLTSGGIGDPAMPNRIILGELETIDPEPPGGTRVPPEGKSKKKRGSPPMFAPKNPFGKPQAPQGTFVAPDWSLDPGLLPKAPPGGRRSGERR